MTREETFNAELAQLGDRLQVKHAPSTSEPVPLYVLWMRTFGDTTPTQLFQQFRDEIGSTPPLHLNIVLANHSKSASIRLYQIDDDTLEEIKQRTPPKTGNVISAGKSVLYDAGNDKLFQDIMAAAPCRLSANFTLPGTLHIGTARFKEQGKGRAAHYLRALAGLGEKLHVPNLTLFAQEVGGYAWAKFGFTPASPEHWRKLQSQVEAMAQDGVLHLPGTPTIAIPDHALPVLAGFAKASYGQMQQAMNALLELHDPIRMPDGSTQTLAQALLLGTQWQAELSLQNNDLGYERFKTYTGYGKEREVAA